jgi:hypothetical protein
MSQTMKLILRIKNLTMTLTIATTTPKTPTTKTKTTRSSGGQPIAFAL